MNMSDYREKTNARDGKRPLFLLSGFLFATGLTLLSFEYRVERTISDRVIAAPISPVSGPVEELVPPPLVAEPQKQQQRQIKVQTPDADLLKLQDTPPDEPDVENIPENTNGVRFGDINIDGLDIALPPDDLSPVEFYERPQFTATFSDCRDVKDPDERFTCTQQMLNRYIASNVTFYPYLYERGVGGTLELSFLIGTDGKVHEVEILQSVHRDLDRQVVDALNRMKPWEPARQGTHVVTQKFRSSVNFQR